MTVLSARAHRTLQDLQEDVAERSGPCCLVSCSPEVESYCAKSGLSLVHLLRPFCQLRNVNAPVRTVGDSAYRIQDLTIRVYDGRTMYQPTVQQGDEHLSQVMSNFEVQNEIEGVEAGSEESLRKYLSDKVERATEMKVPWWKKFRHEYDRMLLFGSHETIDLPVAVVIAVNSSDPDVVSKTKALLERTRQEHGELWNPNLLKHFLLVHDCQNGDIEMAKRQLEGMKLAFGKNECHMIQLNSKVSDLLNGTPPTPDMWSACIGQSLPGGGAGEFKVPTSGADTSAALGSTLSDSDINSIISFLKEFVVKRLIPHLENRIRYFNHHISSTRKGIRNQFKNYWFRKEKDNSQVVNGEPAYSSQSIEFQIRHLGDLSFMMKDYNLALSSYRLISNDFKSDKAWKNYGGAMEMAGLCIVMMRGSQREAEVCLDSAFSAYQRHGKDWKLTVRSLLILSEVLVASDRPREAIGALKAAIIDNNHLRAALLLEQAAYLYILSSKPLYRKFAFHMALAGRHYSTCGNHNLSAQAYTLVLAVHSKHQWPFIDEHMHLSLGKESKQIDNTQLALQCWMRLLVAIYQPSNVQQKYLEDFLKLAETVQAGEKSNVLPLLLPNIDVENVYVHFDDFRCFAAGAYAQSEQVWARLDERVIPPAILSGQNWLEADLSNSKDYLNLCGAQEEIGVDVEFANVLQVTIKVQDVHLDCFYSPDDISSFRSCTDEEVEVKHEKFTLLPQEKTLIRLKVSVKKPGMLKINGVRWLLCGIAYGAQEFDIMGPKRKKVGEGEPQRDHPPHRRLMFQVLPTIPRIEATFTGFPENMYAGEICKCSLTIHNVGAAPLHALRIVSTSNSLIFGEFTVIREESLLDVGSQTLSPTCSKGVHLLPEDFTLNPGMKMQCSVWIYTTEVGNIGMHSAIYFQPTHSHAKMRFRVLHCTQHVQVFPSIQLSGEMLLSEVSTKQLVLHTKIRNSNKQDTFYVKKLVESNGTHDLNVVGAGSDDSGAHKVSPNEQTAIFIEADEKDTVDKLGESIQDLRLQEDSVLGLEPCVLQSLKDSLLVSTQETPPGGMKVPLLVFWHTSSRVTSREHSGVVGMNFLMKGQEKPMHMTVSYPQTTVHNFRGDSICIIPCKISIFNASQQSIHGTLNLENAVQDMKPSWKGLPDKSSANGQSIVTERNDLLGCLPYCWCGKLVHKFYDLQPLETKEVAATVCIFAEGCYEIDNFGLQWSFSNTNFSQYELKGSKFCLSVRGKE
ncbi:trafficking protein particle complex III protein Trs85 [Chloropicon primus]|uniref:Trafficking protein particle complex III protein Trs85 n=1 Tax=Chloropicon primus TaxID=1764295 RepID=A0A5B8MCJ8_9CHLO|nr:trafficking protein particle complex III protein Trs85 [Chloropicon primus]UPQ97345.1 trafficking protein particle complex III protein Trs85 [Chloropicon primus]|eukprot:QDZ18133.1 trafficking protein particle complex III protein Trs85 [Chloropicon primus]